MAKLSDFKETNTFKESSELGNDFKASSEFTNDFKRVPNLRTISKHGSQWPTVTDAANTPDVQLTVKSHTVVERAESVTLVDPGGDPGDESHSDRLEDNEIPFFLLLIKVSLYRNPPPLLPGPSYPSPALVLFQSALQTSHYSILRPPPAI